MEPLPFDSRSSWGHCEPLHLPSFFINIYTFAKFSFLSMNKPTLQFTFNVPHFRSHRIFSCTLFSQPDCVSNTASLVHSCNTTSPNIPSWRNVGMWTSTHPLRTHKREAEKNSGNVLQCDLYSCRVILMGQFIRQRVWLRYIFGSYLWESRPAIVNLFFFFRFPTVSKRIPGKHFKKWSINSPYL